MKFSDLTGIGRLGGPDGEGFYQVLVKPRYRSVFAAAEDVFLIFNSDRVFYVTISERDISDRKIRVKFAEDGIAEERKKHREVILAIENPNAGGEDPEPVIGYTVVFQNREVGKVTDYFHNNAQYVLVVEAQGGKEILIPWVDYFVADIVHDPGVVVLVNAASLLFGDS
ncbi:MAG: PRC-barrel domain-containing protein [Candidatus Syntrophosphaera sp.]|nr:PRC-barrel domain-containing protein [Candidatus Syntrophosphaera sp.]